MHRFLIVPVIAATLVATGCGEEGTATPTPIAPTARVRFFNATPGMSGSGGFTTNGQFAAGSALAFAQAMSACATVNAGATSFGFGRANAGGTALAGNALTTLSNQSVTDGGNFTVAATGAAASPTLYLIDNSYAGSLSSSQAAVRFVNLAPGSANVFNVFVGTLGAGGTLHATSIPVGTPTAFATVASGANSFTVLMGHDIAVAGNAATFTLQGGSVNTLGIVPTTSGTYQLVNLPRCS